MRDLIIKLFALSYSVKLFGKVIRGPRPALPIVFFFTIAGMYTTAQYYFSVWDFRTLDFILWFPAVVSIWIGFPWFKWGYFGRFPLRYADLKDWEQKYYYLTTPKLYAREDTSDLSKVRTELTKKYNRKFYGEEKWVNVVYAAPFAITIISGFVAYYLLA